jgi:hypothetical protein
MKWPDQPFEEITMGDIFDIPSMGDDLFCLQVGLTVKALVASTHPPTRQFRMQLQSSLDQTWQKRFPPVEKRYACIEVEK